jgi:hypothetical protein
MEKYVTLETAQLARDMGLDTELDLGSNCICYNERGELVSYHVHFNYPDRDRYTYAPTQSFLANWLRTKYQIQVYAVSGTISGRKIMAYRDYVGHVCVASEGGVGKVVSTAINDPRDEEYKTYEEAMEAALINGLHRIS